ncbi:MAG TPA: hypothetical protein VGP61_01935 [Gemmatimonadales bacterium]|nr:hypothetical protein [Gemmatimonadales bacterium]
MKPLRLRRIFLLSPASTSGRRARILFSPRASFALALRIRGPEGEPVGEVFSFLSGLYFRGKLAYARAFAQPGSAIRVITCDRGLVSPDQRVTLEDLRSMARGTIDPGHPAYRIPLERDAEQLAALLGRGAEVVLLGSIATDKYAGILQRVFGPRLKFPESFVGRGDMSRGGLLLRAARQNEELAYRRLAGAVRRGKRPARLTPV